LRKPSKNDWILFILVMIFICTGGYFFAGQKGLWIAIAGIVGATTNLIGLGAICRLTANLQRDDQVPFQEQFLLFLLVTQKLPFLIGGWMWAQRLKEPFPTCFLYSAGVVYFVLICWVNHND